MLSRNRGQLIQNHRDALRGAPLRERPPGAGRTQGLTLPPGYGIEQRTA